MNLSHAIAYARKGWRILPLWWVASPMQVDSDGVVTEAVCACPAPDCASQGKHPLTSHGCHDGTTDPRQIEEWWKRYPQANIGLATGQESGVWALDIDLDHDGHVSFRRACRKANQLIPPPTVASITGGGGRHVLWQTWGEKVPNNIGILPGVDLRGDGGLIVIPPSNHESGNRYRWHSEGMPGKIRVQPTPGWVRAIIDLQRNGGQPRRPWDPNRPMPVVDLDKIDMIYEGSPSRNVTLFKICCRMVRFNDPDLSNKAHAINQARCVPPLPDRVVDTIVRSAEKYR